MSTVNVKSTLLNPANQVSPNTPIRLTSVLGYGDTLTSSTTVVTTDAMGDYDFDLVYGTHMIEVRFEDKYVKLGTVVVGSDIGPLTINELLLADTPIVPEYITTVLQAVVDARAAAVQTGLDATATAADRVQTGLDATSTAADRVQTNSDATATAADRVQTNSDATATTADRNTVAAKAAAMELLFDTFDDRYLGQKAVDPTTDNDGNPLVAGTVYFNTTTNTTRFYTGAIWEDPSVSSTNAASAALASQLAAAISEANANDSAISANSNAGIATTKASEASDSANDAAGSATTATEQATIATTKASETSLSEANASASEDAAKLSETNSATSAGIASSAATTATAQAVIATDKATEVSGALAGKLDAGATAVNSDKLDNIDSSGFQQIPVANIPAPLGGYLTTSIASTGCIKIKLPNSWTSTMVSFTVSVYDYSLGKCLQIRVNAYNYGLGSWVNVNANMVSGTRKIRVRLGHDGDKCCIYLGEDNENWTQYINISIINLACGLNNSSTALWSTGWEITTEATAQNVDYDVTLNDWDGVDYVDPDAVGANATAKIYPDGSIVGSTDNGNYTKWPNGDLTCRGNILTVASGPLATYFPVIFSDAGLNTGYCIVGSSVTSDSNVTHVAKFSNKNVNYVGVHTSSGNGVYDVQNINWIATGRWK